MLTLSVIKENPEEVIRRLAIKHFDGKEAINRVLELDKIRRHLRPSWTGSWPN